MSSQSLMALIVGACLVSSTAVAQDAGSDPFAAPPTATPPKPPAPPASDDPFGGSAAARPAALNAIRKARAAMAKGRKPVNIAEVDSDEAEMKILASLRDETSQTFIDTPLVEALQQISQTHDIPIVVDRRALEEIGLSADTPVTIGLKNVTLRSFLRLMLRDLDLTYMIQHQVMVITTIEAAEQNLILEMYKLSPKFAAKGEELLKIIKASVVPDTWSVVGGPSHAAVFDHVMIVSTTSDVHDQVEQFLAKLIMKYGD